jgi:hypothetical protein
MGHMHSTGCGLCLEFESHWPGAIAVGSRAFVKSVARTVKQRQELEDSAWGESAPVLRDAASGVKPPLLRIKTDRVENACKPLLEVRCNTHDLCPKTVEQVRWELAFSTV